MGGPGGGPDLTGVLGTTVTTILGYVAMVMPFALAIMAILLGIGFVKKILERMTK